MTKRMKRDDEMDIEPPPPPKLKNFKEAVESLEDVQQFLESRGYIEEALGIGSAIDTMTVLKLKSVKQTSLPITVVNTITVDYIIIRAKS